MSLGIHHTTFEFTKSIFTFAILELVEEGLVVDLGYIAWDRSSVEHRKNKKTKMAVRKLYGKTEHLDVDVEPACR